MTLFTDLLETPKNELVAKAMADLKKKDEEVNSHQKKIGDDFTRITCAVNEYNITSDK